MDLSESDDPLGDLFLLCSQEEKMDPSRDSSESDDPLGDIFLLLAVILLPSGLTVRSQISSSSGCLSNFAAWLHSADSTPLKP